MLKELVAYLNEPSPALQEGDAVAASSKSNEHDVENLKMPSSTEGTKKRKLSQQHTKKLISNAVNKENVAYVVDGLYTIAQFMSSHQNSDTASSSSANDSGAAKQYQKLLAITLSLVVTDKKVKGLIYKRKDVICMLYEVTYYLTTHDNSNGSGNLTTDVIQEHFSADTSTSAAAALFRANCLLEGVRWANHCIYIDNDRVLHMTAIFNCLKHGGLMAVESRMHDKTVTAEEVALLHGKLLSLWEEDKTL